MKTNIVIFLSAAFIAGTIAFVGRYQIAAMGYGYAKESGDETMDTVYRLDRWTGRVDWCHPGGMRPDGSLDIQCPARLPPAFRGK